MVTKPIYYLGVAESPTIEIPQDELSSLLGQIEAELHSSRVYRSALASLQKLSGETSPPAKALVKAVGREAIRLVFLKLARRRDDVPAPVQEVGTVPPDIPTKADVQPENVVESGPSITVNTSSLSVPEVAAATCVNTTPEIPAMPQERTVTKRTKKPGKAEFAQMAIQERVERLRSLGQELQQARYGQGLSLHQLHERSFVPLHHIEALETGRVELLPEDVYVRGFIRRLSNVLGLDGARMNASLPAPDLAKAVLPSWCLSKSAAGFHLSPMHLYLGYTALVAGAVGGLALLSQQSTLSRFSHPNLAKPSQPLGATAGQGPEAMIPGIKSSHAGVMFRASIAPPEVLAL